MSLLPIPDLPQAPELPGVPDVGDIIDGAVDQIPGISDVVGDIDCNPQKSLCDKFNNQLDDAIKQIENFSNIFRDKLGRVQDKLESFKLDIPSTEIDDLSKTMEDEAAAALPDIDPCDPAEILKTLENCGLAFPSLASPKQMEKDMRDWMSFKLKNIFGDFEFPDFDFAMPDFPRLPSFELPEFQLPEFSISLDFDGLDNLLSKWKFPDLLGSMDGLFNCLDSICKDVDLDDKITRVNNSLSGMGISDSGTLDTKQLMDSVGLSDLHQAGVNKAKSTMADLKSAYTSAAENGATAVTNQTKNMVAQTTQPAEGVIAKYKSLF